MSDSQRRRLPLAIDGSAVETRSAFAASSVAGLVLAATLCLLGCEEPLAPGAGAMENPAIDGAGPCDPATPRATLRTEVVARGLEVPWDFAFAPDGRIFLTERAGRIRVIRDGVLDPVPWAELEVAAESEAGLMGLALAPDFASTGELYVVGTFAKAPAAGWRRQLDRVYRRVAELFSRERGSRLVNRVIRLRERDGRGVEPAIVVDGLRAEQLHAGAALAFGPDGALYVSVGEALEGVAAQQPRGLAGKILRYRRDGSIPDDNPLPGSAVYALGFRNVQGLAWRPETGALWAIDHGPSGMAVEDGRIDRDELNPIVPGGNYGWPYVTGGGHGGGYRWPAVHWSPAIAPAGLTFYTGNRLPWRGDVVVGGLRGRQLRRVRLAPPGPEGDIRRALCDEVLLEGEFGRIRGVAMGPDGALYFATSNRDGRGPAGPDDDRLVRLVPADE